MIRPVAQNAYNALMLDMPLSPAACCDYGVESVIHYMLLRQLIIAGCSLEAFDAALGDGPAITGLVKAYLGDDPNIPEFRTAWDMMGEDLETQEEEAMEREGSKVF